MVNGSEVVRHQPYDMCHSATTPPPPLPHSEPVIFRGGLPKRKGGGYEGKNSWDTCPLSELRLRQSDSPPDARATPCRRPPDAVPPSVGCGCCGTCGCALGVRPSPGLNKWQPCQGGRSQISNSAALPETPTRASGRVVVYPARGCRMRPKSLPEAVRCKQNPCRSPASTLVPALRSGLGVQMCGGGGGGVADVLSCCPVRQEGQQRWVLLNCALERALTEFGAVICSAPEGAGGGGGSHGTHPPSNPKRFPSRAKETLKREPRQPENCSAGGGGVTWTPAEGGGGGGWRNGVPCRALCFV